MRIKFNEVKQIWQVIDCPININRCKQTFEASLNILAEFKTRQLAREYVKQQKELNHE